jgi:hypothetical protein
VVGQEADRSDIPHIVFPMVAARLAKGTRKTVWMAVCGRNGTNILFRIINRDEMKIVATGDCRLRVINWRAEHSALVCPPIWVHTDGTARYEQLRILAAERC